MSRELTFHLPDGGVHRFRASNSPEVGETVRALGQAWVVGGVSGDAFTLATPTHAPYEPASDGSLRGLGLRFMSVQPVAPSRGRS